MRLPNPPINSHQTLLTALSQGKRMDGREMFEMREVSIEFGEGLGEVWVKLGETEVLAQVSATIVKPRDDRPYEGFLLIHSEIGAMASVEFENGRSSEEEVLITRLLEKSIRGSEAIDREALCITAGQRVWQIRLTLHFLSSSGNLLDCAALAGMTALRHFKRGEVEIVQEEVDVNGQEMTFERIIVHGVEDRAPVGLSVHHTPLCVTFAYFENGTVILDPSHLETTLSTGTLTLTLNAQRELCVLSKAGGTPIGVNELMRVIGVGVEKVRELVKIVEGRLKDDEGKRVVDVI